MFKNTTLSLIISLALTGYVYAEDVDTSTTSEDVQKFYDTDVLVETLTSDDVVAYEAQAEATNNLADVQTALQDAEQALLDYEDTGETENLEQYESAVEDAEQELVAAEQAVEDADGAAAAADAEVEGTAELVGELTEEQLFALNRSLNNAADGKLLVNIDMEDLQRVLDGDYNKLQINAFTQAFEQEARFDLKADKFTAKYEETENEKFLEHATRMEEKGADQKTKFEAKIDRFSDNDVKGHAATEAKQTAKNEAKQAAKGAAKNEAKRAAKNEAKQAAKNAAKDAAKGAAKRAAKGA